MLDTFIYGLVNGAMYALVAIGFSLIYSVLGFMNFAHGDLVTLGAYLVLFFGTPRCGMSLLTAALLSALATGLVAVVLGRGLLIPARQRSPQAALVVAIGISILLQATIAFLWSSDARAFYRTTRGPVWSFLPLSAFHLVLLVFVLVSLLLLWHGFFKRTRIGLAIRACAANPGAAYIFGMDRNRAFLCVFFLAGVFASFAGVAKALDDQIVTPVMGFSLGIRAFIASVLGGITSLRGAVGGAFVLGMLEAVTTHWIISIPALRPFGAVISRDAIALAVLALVLVVRPRGLFAVRFEPRP